MKKLRNTRHRRIILEILRTAGAHFTGEEVYAEARKLLPAVGVETVERSLRYLIDKGLVREIRGKDPGGARYEAARGVHAHFHCRGCHAVRNIPLPADIDGSEWHDGGVIASVSSIDLHMSGECSSCEPPA